MDELDLLTTMLTVTVNIWKYIHCILCPMIAKKYFQFEFICLQNQVAAEDNEKDGDAGEGCLSKAEQASAVLLESNDASPKPVSRGLSKDKRSIIR